MTNDKPHCVSKFSVFKHNVNFDLVMCFGSKSRKVLPGVQFLAQKVFEGSFITCWIFFANPLLIIAFSLQICTKNADSNNWKHTLLFDTWSLISEAKRVTLVWLKSGLLKIGNFGKFCHFLKHDETGNPKP